MRRCRKTGCPTLCGTRRKPSCADRMVYYALLVLFFCTVLVSTVSGISSVKNQVQTPSPAMDGTHGAPPWLFDVVDEHTEFEGP